MAAASVHDRAAATVLHARRQWHEARNAGVGRAEFVRTAEPREAVDYRRTKARAGSAPTGPPSTPPAAVPPPPGAGTVSQAQAAGGRPRHWAANETPVLATAVPRGGLSRPRGLPAGAVHRHRERYRLAAGRAAPGAGTVGEPGAPRPGGPSLVRGRGHVSPLVRHDRADRGAGTGQPLGLRPLLAAEIQWGLYAHTQRQHSHWDLHWRQNSSTSAGSVIVAVDRAGGWMSARSSRA